MTQKKTVALTAIVSDDKVDLRVELDFQEFVTHEVLEAACAVNQSSAGRRYRVSDNAHYSVDNTRLRDHLRTENYASIERARLYHAESARTPFC